MSRKVTSTQVSALDTSEPRPISANQEEEVDISASDQLGKTRPAIDSRLEVVILTLKILLWCLSMALFVVLEFGAVFFVCSVFYFMYINLRTSPRKVDEISAYSVFNPGCQRIEGTLSAEQFERELKYGVTSVS